MEKDTRFTDERVEQMAEAMAGYKGEARPKSFRQVVFNLYPAITEALENGATRKELYEKLLTDEERQNYALSTFIGYYHQAKKAAEKQAKAAKRKGAEAAASVDAENADAEKPAEAAPAENPAPVADPVQKVMEKAKSNGNGNPSGGSAAMPIHSKKEL